MIRRDLETGRFLGYETESERLDAEVQSKKRHSKRQWESIKADPEKLAKKYKLISEWRFRNKDKLSETRKKKYKENRLRIREKKFSTPDSWEKQFQLQNGLCAICSVAIDESISHTDHNHITGKFRGLLCANCNKALGLFKDSWEVLEKASKYLKEKG